MALLKLDNIGKIYSTNGTLAVGIRGVNLDFNLGEFVVITGASGSGKTTLLNVMSGLDSYEEGELYIENEPTSHYIQEDWETYRQKYISFVFQDYNIIDSFTVFQNVEMSLFHIEDKKERKSKAIELIEKVGLKDQMHQRGSELSGGQKQRTVIARALAKDSKILLADEPTGNLDSRSAADIVKLLKEISKDRLVVVVTHNAEQFEDKCTREIRIFDGTITKNEFKKTEVSSDIVAVNEEKKSNDDFFETPQKVKQKISKNIVNNGIELGCAKFFSQPKLTLFLVILLIVVTLALFVSTAVCVFGSNYNKETLVMHIDGRVVLAKSDGSGITSAELEEIATKTNAVRYQNYDRAFDYYQSFTITDYSIKNIETSFSVDYVFDGKVSYGRMPIESNEIMLYLPIHYKSLALEKLNQEVTIDREIYKLVGLSFYFDNRNQGKMIMTKEGFEILNIKSLLSAININNIKVDIDDTLEDYQVKYYGSVDDAPDSLGEQSFSIILKKTNNTLLETKMLNLVDITKVQTSVPQIDNSDENKTTYYISQDFANEIFEKYDSIIYKQASLFYKSDAKAKQAVSTLIDSGYNAFASYEKSSKLSFENYINIVSLIIAWIAIVIFLGLFVVLCTTRVFNSTKADLAIFRTMGIKASEIKISVYVHMLLSTIPGIIVTCVLAMVVYLTPLNGILPYIDWYYYFVLFFGVLAVVLLVARTFAKKLFKEHVRKNLRRELK